MSTLTALDELDPSLAVYDADLERMHRRRWSTLAVLCLTLVMVSVDNTILNVALPTLAREFNATASQLQWIVDSYVLVFAGLLLTAGFLGDKFGRRGALMSGMAIFGVGSVAASMAGSTVAAHRLSRVDGRRRRTDHAGHVVDPDQRVPRPEGTGQGDRARGPAAPGSASRSAPSPVAG